MRANVNRAGARLPIAALALLLWLSVFAPTAHAGPPAHPPLPALNIEGLNHACGAAVDSKGDVYLASAGESKVKVFDPAHNELTSISNANKPCGLAVDGNGTLYVSEQATGNVVKYTPNAYPLSGSPTFSGPLPFVSSGNAKGISVDPADDRLYVAEGTRISVFQSDGTTGQNEVQELRVDAEVSGGTFTLSYEAQPTGALPFDATPAQVQAGLEALPAIGAGNVSVAEGQTGTRSYAIAFTHVLGSEDVPSLAVSSAGLIGGEARLIGVASTAGFAFNGHIGEGALTAATAVVPFTYSPNGQTRHYLFVADSSSEEVVVLAGPAINALAVKQPIDGSGTPQGSFGFGPAGAALGIDWSNGHLFVYDSTHKVLDEFELNGRYLDQIASAGFAEAEPSAVAVLPESIAVQEVTVDAFGGSFKLGYEGVQSGPIPVGASAQAVREALEAVAGIGSGNVLVRQQPSGTSGNKYVIAFTGALANRNVGKITVDISALTGGFPQARTRRLPGYGPGRVYLTSGAGAGAKLLAFAPLAAPSRPPLGQPPSQVLPSTKAVTVDSAGDLYAAAGKEIRLYDPTGAPITKVIDEEKPYDLGVDSKGRVYVVDSGPGINTEVITYYTPSSYPPTAATTYVRHEPPLIKWKDFQSENGAGFEGVAVNPSNDHVLYTNKAHTVELDSAAPGHDSAVLNPKFGGGLNLGSKVSVDVCGANGNVYFSQNPGIVRVVNAAGTEVLATIDGAGSPGGLLSGNPKVAVDQSNCHFLAFDKDDLLAAREYDAAGGFVTEFGQFGFGGAGYGIAIDNSGGASDGRAYVSQEEPKAGIPNIQAFGPLSYGEPPFAVTGGATGIGAGSATLNGTVDPRGFEVEDCHFEYLLDSQYLSNGKTFAGATSVACAESLASIGKGSKAVAVHADIAGLDPEGRYRFRLVAENKYGPSEAEASLFGPPVLTTQSALPVLYDEATLRAKIDPAGLVTKYRFEYGPSEGVYDHITPTQ
jgi:hypothetical protein